MTPPQGSSMTTWHYRCGPELLSPAQAFRKFGSAIEMRANIDGPGQLSRVASHKHLFSSDRILGAEALAGERGCESSDSASGEGREEPVGQLVSAAAGRDRLSQST